VSRRTDERHMRRAIELARAVLGLTSPNPAVGCVIARGASVIAEAATAPGGRPHAEEQALAAAGEAARGSTAFVTLEPCAVRSSGAPSCSERLIAAGAARVVFACGDSHALARGAGPAALSRAGLEVEGGFLADEAAGLYR